jgi:hypothetical protein
LPAEISEKYAASILRIEENAKQETSMKRVEELLAVILSLNLRYLALYGDVTRKATTTQAKKENPLIFGSFIFCLIVDFFLVILCSSILWSSGQSSWLQIQRSRVRFPALSDFLRSSGSETGSTQPREYN